MDSFFLLEGKLIAIVLKDNEDADNTGANSIQLFCPSNGTWFESHNGLEGNHSGNYDQECAYNHRICGISLKNDVDGDEDNMAVITLRLKCCPITWVNFVILTIKSAEIPKGPLMKVVPFVI